VAGFAVAQQPQITRIASAAPAATATGNVARGELISIYGSNLANGVSSSFAPISPVLALAGASVSIGNIAAPILYASPTQIDLQVPFEIPAGVPSVSVTVTVGSMVSVPFLMGVVTADLGMFYAQANGTIFPSSQTNTATVQASSGTVVTLYAGGLGSINPAVPSGVIPPAIGVFTASALPPVAINGVSAPIVSATYVALGLYAIRVDVPAGANSGSVTVVLGPVDGAPGATGPVGSVGPAGATGPQGPAGQAGFNGANGVNGVTGGAGPTGSTGALSPVTSYNNSTTYIAGSVVFYQGSTYQSAANANIGNLPTNGAPWTLVAQQGASGSTGPTGMTGAIGATGFTGSAGAAGVAGATGLAGSTGGSRGHG
jgi:uncharacterized protein (TIGR03437 family)